MRERSRNRRESPGSSSDGLGDLFSDGVGAGMVTVYHGVHSESLPVANMTVGEIRRRYGDRFDIDPDARAEVDGRYVTDDTAVTDGQMLLFTNHFGEKGRP